MKLLLTCATIPEFSYEALELWNKYCIAEWMRGFELVRYLQFAPAASCASIDAIVFLQPEMTADFLQTPDGHIRPFPYIAPWEAAYLNAAISQRVRNLPEDCAMRDGRKWKRIPQIVLTSSGYRHEVYSGLDVEFVIDMTQHMMFSNYSTPVTWIQIERIINKYHQEAAAEYERIGFLVTIDHGIYRLRRAYRKKTSSESDFYYGSKDRRRFRGFVTVGRDQEGVGYEALLLEQLLNDPRAGERELHLFFEEHPDFLAEAMMGVPISHQPYFTNNKQTPDFVVSPLVPRGEGDDLVKLLELKGPEARVLANKRRLHRALAPAVIDALAQVRDYQEYIHDPLNLAAVEKALGYIPAYSEKAVLIGRTPPQEDSQLWSKRKNEQVSVKIITYDEILQEQRERQARRRS